MASPELSGPARVRAWTDSLSPRTVRWSGVGMAVLTVLICLGGALTHNIYALAAPLALGIILVCSTAALRDFPVFILTLLMLRPLLDATKSSSGTGLFQPTTFVSIALLIVGPLWLIAQRKVKRIPLTTMTVGMLAMIGSLLISTFSSLIPSQSAVQTLKAAAWLMMFLVVRRIVDSERRIKQLVAAIAISAIIPTLLAVYEAATPGAGYFAEVKEGVVRVRSTFDLANDYARYLMLLILLCVALMPVLTKGWRKVAFCAAVLFTILIGTTYTRSAWFGLAVGLIVIAILQRRRVIIGGMIAGFLVVLVLPQTSSHITSIASSGSASHAQDDSLTWRYQYWGEVLQLVKIDPITGIGPGVTPFYTTAAKEPHNEYLRALDEQGGVGVIAYLLLLGTAIGAGWRVAKRHPTAYGRAMGAGFAAVAVAVTVAGIASNIVLEVSFMWYFAAFGAVADRLSWSLITPRKGPAEAPVDSAAAPAELASLSV